MKNNEYVGYITFVKKNNVGEDKDKFFINNYTKNNINVGDKIHSDEKLIVTKKLEESFHALSSLKMEDWNNLIFARVKANDYTLLDRFYYLKPAILTNDIEVTKILSKQEVLRLIKADLECRYINGIEKYLQFIKFDENEKDFIKSNTTNSFGEKIGAAISYYQDGDKEAFEKLESLMNSKSLIKKTEGK